MDADAPGQIRSALKDLWRIISFLKPFKRQFLLALLVIVGINAMMLARPFIIGKGFNGLENIVREGGTFQDKLFWAFVPVGLYLVFGLGYALMMRIRAPTVMTLSVALLRDLRTLVYHKIQQLSFNYLDRLTNGQIIERATGDVNQIRMFLTMSFIGAFDAVVVAVLMLAFMLALNARLALVAIAPLPLILYLFGKMAALIRVRRREVQDEIDVMTSGLTEGIAGVRVIRSFGKQQMMKGRYREILTELIRRAMRVHVIRSFGMFGVFTMTRLPEIIIVVYGGLVIIGGSLLASDGMQLRIGDLIAYLFYVRMLLWKLHPLMEIGAGAQEARAAFERIVALMDVKADVANAPDAVDLPPGGGRVDFENVSFVYQEPPRPDADVLERMAIEARPAGPAAVENVNLTVEPGEVVALVGPTGAGKSTIVNLLPRFYDPTEGRILIDGEDLRNVRLESLRRNVGLVFQETFLFRGTIAENIAFGRPGAHRGEIIEAADLAQAHEFIHQLPRGYDSEIGERGVSLSGGERQRVAIARAILMRPRILILDDATASVDPVTEYKIRRGLSELMRGRTTFVIAHRLATIRSAGRVVVLRDGRVEDVGTHADLIQRNEFYRTLCEAQSEEMGDAETPGRNGDAAAPGAGGPGGNP